MTPSANDAEAVSWEGRKICPECKASGGPDGVTDCATCREGFWEEAAVTAASSRVELKTEQLPNGRWVYYSIINGKRASQTFPKDFKSKRAAILCARRVWSLSSGTIIS